jgi:hypothetical protein
MDDKSVEPREGVSNATPTPPQRRVRRKRRLAKQAKLFSKPHGKLGPRQVVWRMTCLLPRVTLPKLHLVRSTNSRSWRRSWASLSPILRLCWFTGNVSLAIPMGYGYDAPESL